MLNYRQIPSGDTRFPLAILFHDQGEPLLDLRFPLPLPFPVRNALDIRLTVTGYSTLPHQGIWTSIFILIRYNINGSNKIGEQILRRFLRLYTSMSIWRIGIRDFPTTRDSFRLLFRGRLFLLAILLLKISRASIEVTSKSNKCERTKGERNEFRVCNLTFNRPRNM